MVKKKDIEKAKFRTEIEDKIALQFSDHITISSQTTDAQSREYKQFIEDRNPTDDSLYAKAASYFGKLPSFSAGAKIDAEIEKHLKTAHLTVTAKESLAFALYCPILLSALFAVLLYLITFDPMMALVGVICGLSLMWPALQYPKYIADQWRMEVGNQMVLAVFYIVTYMRHTSNLERAIEFASDHLGGPISMDLRKIIWDVETEKHESVVASLEGYLMSWKGSNDHFIEAMHLIESSLYEEKEERRLEVLDKALDVILDQTYERMLHYAHNLQTPVMTLHMLGVILPILGLVILPLLVAFVPEVQWYHISIIYNIIIPVLVFFVGLRILAKRPSGYGGGASDVKAPPEKNKTLQQIFSHPKSIAALIMIPLLLIAFSPVWIHWVDSEFDIGFGRKVPSGSDCGYQYCLLGYHTDTRQGSPSRGEEVGPYGLGASLLSLLLPLGIGVAMAAYYTILSIRTIKIRRQTAQLESEFGSALFQLGNRLDDGLPAEAAVGVVAQTIPDSVTGRFFLAVSGNIQKLGVSLQEAIFNPQVGAILAFPSNLIESSMKVLIEASRKGPRIAAQALTNISRYLKEMHRVDERLQDLMAEVLSSMRSQISFLTPVIAGIVIGITSMITNILSQLSRQLQNVGSNVGSDGAVVGGTADLANIFSEGFPTYYFQIIVGLYVLQIVFILSILINRIKNGVDPLEERYLLSKNLLTSILLYVIIAAVVMVLFNTIAASIITSSVLG